MADVLGRAIHDYYYKDSPQRLWIYNRFAEKDEMPVHIYFRSWQTMPELEQLAISLCRGTVLDIGAGAGSHSLELQKRGIDVTALEISPLAAEVIKARGVQKVLNTSIFEYSENRYDTLLLMMNGIGLSNTVTRLRDLLQHFKTLVTPGGQVIFDSSDVAYLYDGNPDDGDPYYGEISYQYEYKKKKTNWFTWLYIDYNLLSKVASEEGWTTEFLFDDGDDQFLVRMIIA